jgi:hypothetical protein
VDRIKELADRLLDLEWKLFDIVVVPVEEIDIPRPDAHATREGQDSSLSGSR